MVQLLPSLQLEPSALVGFEHFPVDELQVPAEWHWSSAVHTTAVPVHEPDWQVSPVVHPLPSLHPVPFGAVGFEHVPFAGLHVPATWH